MILSIGFTYGQEKKQPTKEKQGNFTMVTYYHDNGEIQQTGTFNVEGKLHGEWTSFDTQGNKVAVATYNNGKKEGKWFFWTGNVLKEVDYSSNKIASVNEWIQNEVVASN